MPFDLLTNFWYYALPAKQLQGKKLVKKTILGEPLVFGRREDGTVFALQNICPHQGMPLSYGSFDGKHLTCCFHGWRFNTEGTCTAIPSLVADQAFDCAHIKTKAYFCQEHQGNVWVFMGEQTENLPDVPNVPGIDANASSTKMSCCVTQTTLELPSNIDYAVIALMDPAHVPYVHQSWWFRSPKTMKEKSKHFVPSKLGYTMSRHTASTASKVYQLLGGVPETEIRFMLPGIRIEHMTLGDKTVFTGLTTLTPIDAQRTEITHKMYWPLPGARVLKPLIQRMSDAFLRQDMEAAIKQQEGLKSNPKLLMVLKDAGTPVKWYYDLKKEWLAAQAAHRAFENPLQEAVLHWRS